MSTTDFESTKQRAKHAAYLSLRPGRDLDLVAQSRRLQENVELLLAHVTRADPNAPGGRRILSPKSFMAAVRLQMDVLNFTHQGLLAILDQEYEARFWDVVVESLVEGFATHPDAFERIMHRLQALQDRGVPWTPADTERLREATPGQPPST
jgi:hypothetical protein